jgi:O-antigen/teichoic acid export membrane protein
MSRLFKNVAYNVTGQGLVLLLGFVGVKFIFSRLGPDPFGIIYFNQVLTGVLTTALELGVLATTIREVSAHYTTEREYIERLIRTASLFYWGIGLVLLVGIVALAPLVVEKWINLRTLDPDTATTMVRFLAVSALIMLPRALYSSLFQGRQRMELNNSIDVGSSAVQQIGTIVILAAGGDAFAVVKWIALAALLSTGTYMVLVARLFGARVLVPTYSADVVRRNVRFTAHMSVLSLVNMVLIQFDKVIVSKLLPIATVGYYSFASTVVIRISFAAGAIAQAALPSFSGLHQRGESQWLGIQYRKLQDLMCFAMVLPYAAACFGAVPLYSYLFNRQVALTLVLPTALLCLGFLMMATVNIPYTLSVAVGRPDIASRSNVIALFIVVPATTLLVYFFGIAGAASSWIVYQLFVYTYMIPRICRECLHISTWSWYVPVAKAAGLAAATYGSAWFLVVLPHSYSLLASVVAYAVATVVFLAGALLLIGADLRSTIRQLPGKVVAARGV